MEACNGVDDDCDGRVDEDAGAWWSADTDGDSWGDRAHRQRACSQPTGFVARAGDCDDTVADVHPGVEERCNGRDDDCDGTVDIATAPLAGRAWPAAAQWRFVGEHPEQSAGYSLSDAGDLDGDGLDDLLIGLPGDGEDPGRAWVVSQGVVIAELLGERPGDAAGAAVAGLGDVNGDGWGDIAVGAPGHQERSPSGAWAEGAVYILHGPFDADRSLSSADARLLGERSYDGTGESVARAGDVNGDGLNDLLVGAYSHDLPGAPSAGVVFVVPGPMTGVIDLTHTNQLRGLTAADAFGFATAGPGDVNGDGIDDVLVGAPGEDTAGAEAGAAYLFHGPIRSGRSADEADAVFYGEQAAASAGWAVAGADVDGDGLRDLLIGSPELRDGAISGAAYLFAGNPTGVLSAHQAQVRWLGSEQRYLGASLSSAGDVDGDGFDDVLIGAPSRDGRGQLLYFSTPAAGDVAAEDADTWFVGRPGDGLGWAVSAAGDHDADGRPDIAFSTPAWSSNTGVAYVVAGTKLVAPELGPRWYADADADGFGDALSATHACDAPSGHVADATDCDDDAPSVHPGADELCNNVDDDCDGLVDNAPVDPGAYYLDADGDGAGAGASLEVCVAPEGWVDRGDDCDDTTSARSPALSEVCDGVDNDCDSIIDEPTQDTPWWYGDGDGDGWGAGTGLQRCDAPPAWVALEGDCDDQDAELHPEAEELCDSVDNDCDGLIDEDVLITWYVDQDLDGHGAGDAQSSCALPRGASELGDDCEDDDPSVHPGALELCNDVDDDCNGSVDEGLTGDWYIDGDGDGFGGELLTLCVGRPDLVAVGGDCDDHFFAVHPGAIEVCNDVDDDCDGAIDENGSPWYADRDGDGHGDPLALLDECADPGEASTTSDDCDDANALISPDEVEVCDGVDNDCDGLIDEDLTLDVYVDRDEDGYGGEQLTVCEAPAGTVERGGDCDDTLAAVHPDADELCNSLDDNCDGAIDDATAIGATSWYRDADGDGYGDALLVACDAPDGWVAVDGDCEDADPGIHPGADELCNERDDDCDGLVDEEALDRSPWFADADGDGWGAGPAEARCGGEGWAPRDGDCEDAASEVHPEADELCNERDDDCDGLVDEDVATSTWYRDLDGDGHGDAGAIEAGCDAPAGFVASALDCDDTDPTIHPGATEVCDGIDNDCSGWVDRLLRPRRLAMNLDEADLRILADEAEQDAGWAVSSAGDVDGDGYEDVIVGVPGDLGETGAAYLFYGPRRGTLRLSDANAVLMGERPGDLAGYAVVGAGDLDGDGYDDLAVSAPGHRTLRGDRWAEGAVYLVHGPLWGAVDLSEADSTLVGEGRFDFAGSALASAGDLNGDGLPDLIVGAENRREPRLDAGVAYVVTSPFASTFGLEASTAVFQGVGLLDSVGSAVSAAGDVNGDGFDDLIVGGWGHDGDFPEAGSAWLFLGPVSGELREETASARIRGDTQGGLLGWSVAGAGDVDGDGLDEVLVGAPFSDDGGRAYIFGWPLDGDVSTSAAERVYTGMPGDLLGYAVSSAGDVDRDGLGDVAVGAPGRAGRAGAVLVYTTHSEEAAPPHTTWYSTQGATEAGFALAPAGDIDADGIDELFIGGPFGAEGGRAWAVQGGEDRFVDLRSWWYADRDGDGWGAGSAALSCEAPADHVPAAGDCDDEDSQRSPGAVERCNELDDDCDGLVDEGAPADGRRWFADADQDGWGSAEQTLQSCAQPQGYTSREGDCDDTSGRVHPDAPELCDGVDNDCDGVLDTTTVDALPARVQLEVVAVEGDRDEQELGWAVAALDDVDGDGEPDWLIGAPGEGEDRGAAYILRGPLDRSADLSDAYAVLRAGDDERHKTILCHIPPGNHANAHTIEVGEPALTAHLAHGDLEGVCPGEHRREHSAEHESDAYRAGHAVDAADLNGDGEVDLIIGAPGEDDGRVYIVYGPVSGRLDLDLADAVIEPPEAEDRLDHAVGAHLSAAGDLNGDGRQDLLITTNRAGEVFGFFGPLEGRNGLDDASVHFAGLLSSPQAPLRAWVAGDLDGDGFDEIAIAEREGASPGLRLYYGPFDGEVPREHASLVLPGAGEWSVSPAGDLDGDGKGDLALSDLATGEVHLYRGHHRGELDRVATLRGEASAHFGRSVRSLGDVDGDGHVDLAVGSPGEASSVAVFLGPFAGERVEADAIHRGRDGETLGWHLAVSRDAHSTRLLAGTLSAHGRGAVIQLTLHPLDESSLGATWYPDEDSDGFGAGEPLRACARPPGTSPSRDDCDDAQPAVHPGSLERCNSTDDDCDGQVDEDAVDAPAWLTDSDGDGFGAGAALVACEAPADGVLLAGDCDDADSAVFPGAPESCNLADDDCDGRVDEDAVDAPARYLDRDGDGFGTADWPVFSCEPLAGESGLLGDCDDRDPARSPSATESCNNLDDDCDGLVDEEVPGAPLWFVDADGDGHGSDALTTRACAPSAGWSATSDDCDDTRWATAPGRPEVCDGRDNDCDLLVDEDGGQTWYADGDGDGFGDRRHTMISCTAGPGWSSTPGDCEDADAAIHPWAPERCDDVDSDCDGLLADGDEADRLEWHLDKDGDGYGRDGSVILACTQPDGTLPTAGDCRDWDDSVHPGAPERCNGLDDDCDSAVDEDAVDPFTWYEDADRDGHGVATRTVESCTLPVGYAALDDDCDDTEYAVTPGRREICDHLDNDCNGQVDDGVGTPWYRDADADGYGNPNDERRSCTLPEGYVATRSDCDDADASVHPRAEERCDAVDSDCDGLLVDGDETDAALWYLDKDLDGYGRDALPLRSCTPLQGYVEVGGDCKDWDETVNPGVDERCDGIDNDCDGVRDEGEAVDASEWHADFDRDGHGASALSLHACVAPAGWLADASDCDDRDASTVDCPAGPWVQVVAGRDFSCALDAGGGIQCWGDDSRGVVSNTPAGSHTELFAGDEHACALDNAGTLRCWGDNSWLQAEAPAAAFQGAGLGSTHSCGLDRDDHARCWGTCESGECDVPREPVIAVDAGDARSCALSRGGSLRCWGAPTQPSTGRFALLALASGRDTDHGCAIGLDQKLWCWDEQHSRSPLSGFFTQISVGGEDGCGLRRDGTVACWSLSAGTPRTPPRGVFRDVAVGGSHACGITRDGALQCWGDGGAGQLEVP